MLTEQQKADRLASIRRMRRSGYTLDEIGAAVHLSFSRVSLICKQAGIQRTTLRHSAAFLEKPSHVRDLYVRAMRRREYTFAEVAAVFDISVERVRQICREEQL